MNPGIHDTNKHGIRRLDARQPVQFTTESVDRAPVQQTARKKRTSWYERQRRALLAPRPRGSQ